MGLCCNGEKHPIYKLKMSIREKVPSKTNIPLFHVMSSYHRFDLHHQMLICVEGRGDS